MDYGTVVNFVQEQFTDGLTLVISGLSAAEGIPGMAPLTTHLIERSSSLTGPDAALWSQINDAINEGEGLEAALLKHPPTDTLEVWIAQQTSELLVPKEREVLSAVLRGEHTLRLTTFLAKILAPATGLPILTPNYDRLIEVARDGRIPCGHYYHWALCGRVRPYQKLYGIVPRHHKTREVHSPSLPARDRSKTAR